MTDTAARRYSRRCYHRRMARRANILSAALVLCAVALVFALGCACGAALG